MTPETLRTTIRLRLSQRGQEAEELAAMAVDQRWLRARSLCQPRPALLLWLLGDVEYSTTLTVYATPVYTARYGHVPVLYTTEDNDLGVTQVLVALGLTPWASGAERAAPAQSDACYRDGACDGSCAL